MNTDDFARRTRPAGMLDIPESIDTPSLVVDLALVRDNLDGMAAFAAKAGVALSPHVKTHRTPEFARMQQERGVTSLCVAKLSEAEAFLDAGFKDFVVAYPIATELKFDRAKRLIRRGARVRFSTDDLGAAESFARSLLRDGLSADLLVIVDTGYERCGVDPDASVELAAQLAGLEGVRFKGILTHEGHAVGAPGDEGLRAASRDAGTQMHRAAQAIRARGIAVDTVSVGSTATTKHTVSVDGITEVRPGIYPFNDLGQLRRGTVSIEQCAARVLATVVSHPAPDRAILDAGSKSLGQDLLGIWFADGDTDHGLVLGLPEGWRLHQLSEEHGWLRWKGGGDPPPLRIGQRVQILPNHICSVFHALGESMVVERGKHVATWTSSIRACSQ